MEVLTPVTLTSFPYTKYRYRSKILMKLLYIEKKDYRLAVKTILFAKKLVKDSRSSFGDKKNQGVLVNITIFY
jgi:hypothetical protein